MIQIHFCILYYITLIKQALEQFSTMGTSSVGIFERMHDSFMSGSQPLIGICIVHGLSDCRDPFIFILQSASKERKNIEILHVHKHKGVRPSIFETMIATVINEIILKGNTWIDLLEYLDFKT